MCISKYIYTHAHTYMYIYTNTYECTYIIHNSHFIGGKLKMKSPANPEKPLHKCRKRETIFITKQALSQTVMRITSNLLM